MKVLFYNYLYIILFILMNLVNLLFSQDSAWVNITVEVPQEGQPKTKNLAIQEARAKAIQEYCGVGIQNAGLLLNQLMASNILEHVSYGVVLDQRIISAKPVTYRKSDVEFTILYQLNIDVLVQCMSNVIDPSFQVEIKANNTIFREGDELVLTITSTKDCYITLFNISENQEMVVLFPNFINRDNFILAGKQIKIPSEKEQAMGIHFRVAPLPKYKNNSEIIKVIATKDKIDFLPNMKNINSPEKQEIAGGMTLYKSSALAIDELYRWLIKIPPEHRAEDVVVYKVYAK